MSLRDKIGQGKEKLSVRERLDRTYAALGQLQAEGKAYEPFATRARELLVKAAHAEEIGRTPEWQAVYRKELVEQITKAYTGEDLEGSELLRELVEVMSAPPKLDANEAAWE